MTFKNKKNLYHTRRRIKRKNISRCLSGGGGRDPAIFYICSNNLLPNYDRIETFDNDIYKLYDRDYKHVLADPAKVFQDFIDIQEARSNLEVIYYNYKANPKNSFKLSIFKYTHEEPFLYGKICIVTFGVSNYNYFTLSNNKENLQLFRDSLKLKYEAEFTTIAHAAANNNYHLYLGKQHPATDSLHIRYFV